MSFFTYKDPTPGEPSHSQNWGIEQPNLDPSLDLPYFQAEATNAHNCTPRPSLFV